MNSMRLASENNDLSTDVSILPVAALHMIKMNAADSNKEARTSVIHPCSMIED